MGIKENWEHLSPVQKAEFTVAYLQSDGGRMSPENFQKFLLLMIKESDFLSRVTVLKMKADQHNIDTLRFGARALHTALPGVALASAQRTRPTLGRQTLTAKLFKAEVELEREVLEDNIEADALQQTVMTKLADRCKEDVCEIVINSDTSLLASIPDLGQFNGYYAAAVAHTVGAIGVPALSKTLLEQTLKVLPSEYRRPDKVMAMTGTVPVMDYLNSLGDRQTAMGDKAFEKAFATKMPGGIPVLGEPEIRENLGIGGHESVCVLADPKNFHVGFHPNMEIETDKDIRAGTIFMVVRLRLDAKWSNVDATAKLTGIAGS